MALAWLRWPGGARVARSIVEPALPPRHLGALSRLSPVFDATAEGSPPTPPAPPDPSLGAAAASAVTGRVARDPRQRAESTISSRKDRLKMNTSLTRSAFGALVLAA